MIDRSIANGLAIGIVSWVAIKLLTGRGREVRGPLYVLAALLMAFAAFFDTR